MLNSNTPPLIISDEVRQLEAKHREYEDVLAFMVTPSNPNPAEENKDPREDTEKSNTQSTDYVTMESLAALEAFAPGLIDNQCANDKHVTMFKDEKRKEVWVLTKTDDHIIPKGTIFGGYGSGILNPRKGDRVDCVPWVLPDGDKTYVQLAGADDNDAKTKPKVGTLYTVVKPLEKLAAKKGVPITLTSYGKVEAKGAAGKHGFGFEFPTGHPKHQAQEYIMSAAKAGAKTTNSGNFFQSCHSGWLGRGARADLAPNA